MRRGGRGCCLVNSQGRRIPTFSSKGAVMGQQSDADRNLLFGLLALQNNFIDHATLIGGIKEWIADKGRPLGRILGDRGAVSGPRLALLEALVEEHVKLHGG